MTEATQAIHKKRLEAKRVTTKTLLKLIKSKHKRGLLSKKLKGGGVMAKAREVKRQFFALVMDSVRDSPDDWECEIYNGEVWRNENLGVEIEYSQGFSGSGWITLSVLIDGSSECVASYNVGLWCGRGRRLITALRRITYALASASTTKTITSWLQSLGAR